jgi:hypothetical protein
MLSLRHRLTHSLLFSTFAADIYDKVQEELEAVGFDTECLGGGRILHDPSKRSIQVYGYSQVCYQLAFIIFNDPNVPRLELESLASWLLYNPPIVVKQITSLLGRKKTKNTKRVSAELDGLFSILLLSHSHSNSTTLFIRLSPVRL